MTIAVDRDVNHQTKQTLYELLISSHPRGLVSLSIWIHPVNFFFKREENFIQKICALSLIRSNIRSSVMDNFLDFFSINLALIVEEPGFKNVKNKHLGMPPI